ncbi:hypothetical protein HDU84_005230 [Entophlyctis sp. JEL0112]|nr:hypothetical protein HDU84_005230 [Entophlyctis sp. JEL0112]
MPAPDEEHVDGHDGQRDEDDADGDDDGGDEGLIGGGALRGSRFGGRVAGGGSGAGRGTPAELVRVAPTGSSVVSSMISTTSTTDDEDVDGLPCAGADVRVVADAPAAVVVVVVHSPVVDSDMNPPDPLSPVAAADDDCDDAVSVLSLLSPLLADAADDRPPARGTRAASPPSVHPPSPPSNVPQPAVLPNHADALGRQQAQIALLVSHVESLQLALDQAHAQLALRDASAAEDLEKWHRDYQEYEETKLRISLLEHDLRASEEHNSHLEDRAASLERLIQSMQTKIDSPNSGSPFKTLPNSKIAETPLNVEEYDSLRAEIQTLSIALESALSQSAITTREAQALSRRLLAADSHVAALTAENATLAKTFAADRRRYDARISSLQAHCAALATANEDLRKKETSGLLDEKVVSVRVANENPHLNLKNVEVDRSVEMPQSSGDNDVQHDTVAALSKPKEVLTTNESASESLALLAFSLGLYVKDTENREEILLALKGYIAELQDLNNELRKSLDSEKSRNIELQSEISELRAEVVELQDNCIEFSEMNTSLEEMVESLKNREEQLKATLQAAESATTGIRVPHQDEILRLRFFLKESLSLVVPENCDLLSTEQCESLASDSFIQTVDSLLFLAKKGYQKLQATIEKGLVTSTAKPAVVSFQAMLKCFEHLESQIKHLDENRDKAGLFKSQPESNHSSMVIEKQHSDVTITLVEKLQHELAQMQQQFEEVQERSGQEILELGGHIRLLEQRLLDVGKYLNSGLDSDGHRDGVALDSAFAAILDGLEYSRAAADDKIAQRNIRVQVLEDDLALLSEQFRALETQVSELLTDILGQPAQFDSLQAAISAAALIFSNLRVENVRFARWRADLAFQKKYLVLKIEDMMCSQKLLLSELRGSTAVADDDIGIPALSLAKRRWRRVMYVAVACLRFRRM